MQLGLDFERKQRESEAEARRRAENRRRLTEHLSGAGIGGLQSEMLVAAANEARIVEQDGLRRLPWRQSERKLAARLGCSKSGVHEALEALEARGLVTRGVGLVVVEWDAVCGLEATGEKLPRARFLETQENSNQPTNPVPSTKNQEPRKANGVPSRQAACGEQAAAVPRAETLGCQVRWKELFCRNADRQWQADPDGVERLHAAATAAGWVGPDDFHYVLGLVMWLPSADRRASGVEHPIGWLIAALRGGREAVSSWPPPECFEAACSARSPRASAPSSESEVLRPKELQRS